MINLTLINNDGPYYLNPDKLIGIYVDVDQTYLDVGTGHDLPVTESPEQVARLITEYKQRQMRLQAAYNSFYHGNEACGPVTVHELYKLESVDRDE